MRFVHGFTHGARSSSAFAPTVRLVGYLDRDERAADDQLRERVGDPAIGLQVGLDVLLYGERHLLYGERHVGMPDATKPLDAGS
jgi:hypothetical protein